MDFKCCMTVEGFPILNTTLAEYEESSEIPTKCCTARAILLSRSVFCFLGPILTSYVLPALE